MRRCLDIQFVSHSLASFFRSVWQNHLAAPQLAPPARHAAALWRRMNSRGKDLPILIAFLEVYSLLKLPTTNPADRPPVPHPRRPGDRAHPGRTRLSFRENSSASGGMKAPGKRPGAVRPPERERGRSGQSPGFCAVSGASAFTRREEDPPAIGWAGLPGAAALVFFSGRVIIQ